MNQLFKETPGMSHLKKKKENSPNFHEIYLGPDNLTKSIGNKIGDTFEIFVFV